MLNSTRLIFLIVLSSWLSSGRADLFVVDRTTGDSDLQGTLYWAIAQANLNPGLDEIEFNLTEASRYVYIDNGPLEITDQVDINGETPDGSLVTLVAQGFNGTPSAHLLRLQGSHGSAISNLVLQGFSEVGIAIERSSSENLIQNNWINCEGADASAIIVRGEYNTVGYNAIADCARGIEIGEDYLSSPPDVEYTATGNYIYGNRIGDVVILNPTFSFGTNAYTGLVGSEVGILIGAGAAYNWIVDNYIEGNDLGIKIAHPTASSNAVAQNRLGYNNNGILVTNGAPFNAIGGAAGGNYIHSDGTNIIIGLEYAEDGTQGQAGATWVQNNVIGASRQYDSNSYLSRLGGYRFNNWVGITVEGGSNGIEIRGNMIIANEANGIQFYNSCPCSVLDNWIGTNYQGVGGTWQDGAGNGAFGIVSVNSGPLWISGNAIGDNSYGFIYEENSQLIFQ